MTLTEYILKILPQPQVAAATARAVYTVRRMMDSGLLPMMKIGRSRRMTAGQWQEVLDGKWTGVAA